jgi:cytochrome c
VEARTISVAKTTIVRQVGVASRCLRLSVAAAACAVAATHATAQDVDPGRQQFVTSCGVCHTAELDAPHRQGPNLFGIFGRKAAQIATFKYSEALATADIVWDEPTLNRWMEDAAAMQPGTIMSYRQRDPEKRKLILQYLKTLQP